MSIWSHRKVAALIATLVITLIAALSYTPAKAQDVGALVTVSQITGNGKVTSGTGWSDPISCPGDCAGHATSGGLSQLFATPDTGWSAVGWGTTGSCKGQPKDLCEVNFFGGGKVSMIFALPIPEIDVRGGLAVLLVANSDTTPDPNNGTDFGLANVSGHTLDQTFSIGNTGIAALTLNGTPLVSLSGPNASDFTLMSPPAATVPSNSSTTFVLRFDPSAAGERTATVTIANDDSDEAPYSFSIRGTGFDAITGGPSPVNYSESIDGDLKNQTLYVPCSENDYSDEFVLGIGVNRWTGTVGVTGTGANQNDMFRARLPAGAYIDRITFQRESVFESIVLTVNDAASQTLLKAGLPTGLFVYDPPSQNSILDFMLAPSFNSTPKTWTITVNVVGSVQGGSGPLLTFEGDSPAQVTINEGQLGSACGLFSDREGDAVHFLPGPLTASPVLKESGPIESLPSASANSAGRWQWDVTPVDGPSDSQAVVLRATDNNPAGANSSQLTFQLNVANIAPTVNKSTISPDPSNEIATVSAQATWSDPGVLDVATCTVDYGDGSAPVAGVANFNSGNGLCSGSSHTYADSGSYVISIVVTDKDGGVGSNSYTYVVNNLPPVIRSVANNGPIKLIKSAMITVDATDPAGAVDPLTYAFDCNNDSVFEKGPQLQHSASCTFPVVGDQRVNVQVSDDDGGVSTSSTLVHVVPYSPPIAHDQSISTNEDTSIQTTFIVSDATGDSLTYSLVAGPGNGTLSGTPPTVTYMPKANYTGVDSFTFKANDGEADSQIATVTITVNPVNDAPAANDDSFNIAEDTSDSSSVTGNDSDVEGDTLAYSVVTNVNHGTLTLDPDGSFTYTPANDYNGSDSFTYQASDGKNGTDTATVKITVNAINDAPKVTNDSVAGVEDTAVTVTVMTNDSDSADGGPLNPAAVSVLSGPTSGKTSVNAVNGTIIYTPTANFYGSDSFTYQVCDNGIPLPALCGNATVTLIIAEVTDDDDDGDGVADMNDVFPLDKNESVDADGDGAGNSADTDDDNDGIADTTDALPLNASESVDTDGDRIGNNADTDDDGDGVADTNDAFPLEKDEIVDTDGDGTGNNADTDDDNDGIADDSDTFPLGLSESVDTDGDGAGNNVDTDDDNDNVADTTDAFPLEKDESLDTDGDGIGNNADTDDDNDGIADDSDTFPLGLSENVDTDGDGAGNNVDTDDDNDNVADTTDAFPLDKNESVDTDGDGTGNNADTDDDGDGVADSDDTFPLDASESLDTDGDGTANNADNDDDDDGVADTTDAFPLDPSESLDTDGDGTGNNADTDDDGDGVADTQPDNCPLISNSDQANNDGDALGDACDDARAAIGDAVWFDQNNNGIQEQDEAGIGGVGIELYKVDGAQIASVDGTLVTSTTTNSAGEYRFTNLDSGDYYLVYTPPAGFGFTLHDVNDNSQESIDSDPVVPMVLLSVSNFDLQGAVEFDSDLVYTIHYTNTDPSNVATNIVITAAVPAGTSFVAASSDPAWSCTSVNAGGICTITIASLNAESFGSLSFVVNLKGSDSELPEMLELPVELTNGSQARTQIVTLVEGEENHSVSAGLIRTLVVTLNTPLPNGPTNLPGIEQPTQQQFLFLPTVQTQG